jgi:hypothetical protein
MSKFRVLESIKIFANDNSIEINVEETLDGKFNVSIKDHRKSDVRLVVELSDIKYYMDLEKAMGILRKAANK